MSAALSRLRKKAAELEQKRQFDRALEVYIQLLDEGGKDLGDEDVPLFNRVGDMLMRKGSVTEALGYYERAVDLYAERGFLNNAIALCSKILRQSPGRAAVYYKLGRISARKGFKSDARKNFLEYADRMQKAGQSEEAFRALKEFASLYPDQDDVRLILAELLSRENRKGEALEQLQALYQKLEAEGRRAEARATIDRMRAIDPSVTPRDAGVLAVPAPGDLVFLDLSEEEPRVLRPVPTPSPSAAPTALAPEVPDVPALSGLSVTFMPDETESAPDASFPDGFEATALEEAPRTVEAPETSLDEPGEARDERPHAAEAGAERPEESLDEDLEPPDGFIEAGGRGIGGRAGTPAEPVPLLQDFEPTVAEPGTADANGRAAPDHPALTGSEFAGLELAEVPRQALNREHDLALPGDLPVTPEPVAAVPPLLESTAAAEDARAAAEDAAEAQADLAFRAALQRSSVPAPGAHDARPETPSHRVPDAPSDLGDTGTIVPDESDDEEGVYFGAADVEGRVADLEPGDRPAPDAPDDFLASPPHFGDSGHTVREHAFPPLPGLDEVAGPDRETAAVPPAGTGAPAPAPKGVISLGGAEGHLRRRLELEPENWELRRGLGEALLDSGDRDGGLYELELAMVGFELDGDMDRAQEVVDVILNVIPASVRHHQKRVEYAVRSRDRTRLTFAYLELADALFRTGTADKAVAVYSRVLELDGANERAEFALATLAPEALTRLRGCPGRPSRWTDELEAIDGPIPARDQPPATEPGPPADSGGVPDDGPHGEASELGAVELDAGEVEWSDEEGVGEAVGAPEAPGAPEVEWSDEEGVGEVVGAHEAPGAPEPVETAAETAAGHHPAFAVPDEPADAGAWDAPDEPDGPVSTPLAAKENEADPAELLAVETSPAELATGPEADPETAAPFEPSEAPLDEQAAPETGPSERAAAVAQADEPTAVEAGPSEPPPAPAEHPWAPAEADRIIEPAPTRLEQARRLTPAAAADGGFVDLGEWLRMTEPARSTRMLVEDPKPTGDEQADFEELLRRFKRGVAENVEAEDYEAHYDLGVAYKEMGLVDEAIAQFQKALRGASHRVRSYEALGQCFVEKRQYPIAAALLQRATELPGTDDQQLVGVLYLLGFAMEHMGRPAEALPYYLRVFAVDIEFRDIAQRVAAMGNATT